MSALKEREKSAKVGTTEMIGRSQTSEHAASAMSSEVLFTDVLNIVN